MDISEIKKSLEENLSKMDELIENLKKEREKIKGEIDRKIEELQLGRFNKEEIENFLKEPYVIIPKRENEFYVIAPRWIDFQIGWLERQTKSYNIFVVNRYVQWIAPVPEALREKLKFPKPLPLKVVDGFLLTGKELQDEAFSKYRHFLSSREGSDRIRIKRGAEFKLISQLIEDGILPFIPKPVQKEDLRDWNGFELRSYQENAWKEFLEKGACGIYWAFGSGKSFFGIYVLARIKGEKLVVVPTLTLKEQWEERIEKHIPELKNEIEVVTYHAYEKLRNKEFNLIIFDECLTYETPILLTNGTIKPIGEIVENKEYPEVLSFNFITGGIEPKPITWLFKKYTQNLLEIKTEKGFLIKVTPTHKIYTSNGWKEAKNLNIGDSIYISREVNYAKMSNLRKQLLVQQFPLQASFFNPQNQNQIYLPILSERIPFISQFKCSYNASQIPRTQQNDCPEISLEQNKARKMEEIQRDIVYTKNRRKKSILERWNTSQYNKKENENKRMYALWILS